MNPFPVLKVSRKFAQSPERVFDAWLDPKIARKFLFTTPDSEMVRADIDARVGGKFCFIDRRSTGEFKGDIKHIGEYLVIERLRKLAFTFGVPQFDPRMTTVTIEIAPLGSGCELTLTHEGVPPEWADKTSEGWAGILANAERAIA